MIEKTWFDYDKDRSGYLESKECIKFLNAFLSDHGIPPVSW
jgi:hypothetical protein